MLMALFTVFLQLLKEYFTTKNIILFINSPVFSWTIEENISHMLTVHKEPKRTKDFMSWSKNYIISFVYELSFIVTQVSLYPK